MVVFRMGNINIVDEGDKYVLYDGGVFKFSVCKDCVKNEYDIYYYFRDFINVDYILVMSDSDDKIKVIKDLGKDIIFIYVKNNYGLSKDDIVKRFLTVVDGVFLDNCKGVDGKFLKLCKDLGIKVFFDVDEYGNFIECDYGLKFDDGKVRMELVDMDFVRGVAKVLTFGALKYFDNSWKNVDDGYNRYLGALLRHIAELQSGKMIDDESGLNVIDHIGCNVMFLRYFLKKDGLI